MSSRCHSTTAGLVAGIASVATATSVSAAIVRAGSSQSTNAGSDPFAAIELLTFKWGWLIGVVVIALVIVRRKRKAP